MNLESRPAVMFPLTEREVEAYVNDFFPIEVEDRKGVVMEHGKDLLSPELTTAIQGLVAVQRLTQHYGKEVFPLLSTNPSSIETVANASIETSLVDLLLTATTPLSLRENITEARILLAQASNKLQTPIKTTVNLSKIPIAGRIVRENLHELKTPITIINGYDEMLHLAQNEGLNEEGSMVALGIKSIEENLPIVEKDFTEFFDKLRQPREPEEHTTTTLAQVIQSEVANMHESLSITVGVLPSELLGERVQITDVYAGRLIRNILRNAVRFAPNNPNAPIEISFYTGKNESGRECMYLEYKDIFGGFLANTNEDGSLQRGADGFQFQYESTRGKLGDTHAVDKGFEGGEGLALSEIERLLFYLDGVRLSAGNHEVDGKKGARISVEIPLLPLSFPLRLAYDDTETMKDKIAILAKTNGVDPFDIVDSNVGDDWIKHDNKTTALIPLDLRAPLTEEQFYKQVTALQEIKPHVLVVNVNLFNWRRMIYFSKQLPDTTLIAMYDPHVIFEENQEEFHSLMQSIPNIVVIDPNSILFLRNAFIKITDNINTARTMPHKE